MPSLYQIVCRISFNFVIKVADFGLAVNLGAKNYFRQKDTKIKLPMRWLAPESMHDFLFSEKSDVVSLLTIYYYGNYCDSYHNTCPQRLALYPL